MKVYTKRGDQGETDLYKGGRVPKTDVRVEACGWIDALSVELGVIRAMVGNNASYKFFYDIQQDLIAMGAFVSSLGKTDFSIERVGVMERMIDKIEATLPELKEFVIPGATPLEAQLHRVRVTCRTAERRVLQAGQGNNLGPAIVYLNRLSDLLFVMARKESL